MMACAGGNGLWKLSVALIKVYQVLFSYLVFTNMSSEYRITKVNFDHSQL